MREMKDSGIKWIGDIPMDWEISRIKYVSIFQPVCDTSHLSADSIITYTPMENIKNGGYIPNTCEFGKLSSSLTQYCEGDIVMAKVTPCFENGNIAIMNDLANGFGLGSSELFVFRPYHINTKYLFYWLRNYTFIEEACSTMTGTGGLKRISPYFMKNCYLHIPPVNEQQTIAVFLDKKCSEIDDVIAKTRATIEEYKKLKQSVITKAVTKGIRPNREMKDSGIEWIGEIPKEWEISLIKYHLKWKSEKGFSDEQVLSLYRDYGVIPKDSRDDNHNVTSLDTSTYKLVDTGDFVINKMKAWQGSMAVSEYRGIISPAYHICEFYSDAFIKRYFHYLMRNNSYLPEYERLSTGMRIGQWDLGFDDFKNIPIIIPSLSEQQEIADYLDKKSSEIDTLIAKKEQIVTELENYKKSLIYEYVTGKREVSDMTEKEETITIFDPQAARRMQMALAYKVIKQSGNDLKGRIHLMKIIYMLDCMLGLGLGINYLRYTRGPYNPIIESIEKNLSDKGIISVNTAKNYSYTVIDDSFDSKYNELFAKHNSEIEKIIDYMKRMKSSRAEKIATLYAAWNDMVIDGVQNITDKMIIDDVMNNWTENKAKTDFSTWQHILNDMKDKKIIPHGYGKHTRPRSE